MTTQILCPPELDNLSKEDKKRVIDLIKSIVQAEEATNILLDLLSSKKLDLVEFRDSHQEWYHRELNLEISLSYPPEASEAVLSTDNISNDIPPPPPPAPQINIIDFILRYFRDPDKVKCRQICENGSPQQCIDCLRS